MKHWKFVVFEDFKVIVTKYHEIIVSPQALCHQIQVHAKYIRLYVWQVEVQKFSQNDVSHKTHMNKITSR